MKYSIFKTIFMSIILFYGCTASKQTTKSNPPKWINTLPSFNEDQTILKAVGSSENMGKEGRSWYMAELSARKQMAFIITSSFEAYKKTFKNHRVGEHVDHIFQEHHQKGDAHFTKMDLKKRWYDPNKDRYYVLVTVQFGSIGEELKKQIQSSENIPQEEKEEAIKAVTKRSQAAKKRLSEKLKNMKWE